MRKVLVTVNFGNVICANARASFEDAARRWGAGYVEITEREATATSWHEIVMLRTRLFDLVDADRILSLDGGDTVIAGWATSPFEACPPDALGAVGNAWRRFGHLEEIVAQERREWDLINVALDRDLPGPERFLNVGVMALSRRAHARVLKRAREVAEATAAAGTALPWPDQTGINYAAAELGTPVHLLDETWNFMHPEQVGHWRFMEECVYHFAGDHQRRASVIPTLRWREPRPEGSLHVAVRRGAFKVFHRLNAGLRRTIKRIPVVGPALRRLRRRLQGLPPLPDGQAAGEGPR